ncbi:paraneoplastic antigen Ma1-like [Pholidichthys leucotaenia]
MSMLKNWCKGEGLDLTHAIIVKWVPLDATPELNEDTLHTMKALGRVRIKGWMFDPQTTSFMILCEYSERVNTKAIPLDVLSVEVAELWTLHGPEQVAAGGDGENVVHIPEPPILDPTPGDSVASIIKAVGDLLSKTMKPTPESNVFQCLRAFSGIVPTPVGEENLDTWIKQARLMVDECDCSDREKQKRIMESLKGPALDIAQAVRANDPEAAPEEYIDALERTFGTSETGEDLYFSFRALHQS